MEAAAPRIVAVDGNEKAETISTIIERAKQLGAMSKDECYYLGARFLTQVLPLSILRGIYARSLSLGVRC